ncbi:MAG: proline--tRNA ligase [Nanoarchaeota archaeon]|nr:proline--tRNA ligase [Nanoarchaeota archaeon]
MDKKPESKGVSIKKNDDMPEWYGQVVTRGQLADYSPVRGTMIIRPAGYALWESIQSYFNSRIKALGVRNAYFPLFIPESFFKKEAQHAEGFAPEVAWVENKDESSQERLAIRPTSETIIYDSYSRWIRSHRDLPMRLNQWCNVVRWEVKDVKLFLRSREFLWQEGHCAYATEEQCQKETRMFLGEYEKLCNDLLALPVITGSKSERETFAGAKESTTIEAFMPDGKFLQCGTSHNLGQGFARSFGISFLGEDEKPHHPWQNSWGFSTRLIGAVVMQHGDDKGLVMPPNIAPLQIVIVPILFEKTREATLEAANKVAEWLKEFRVEIDARDEYTAGWKFNDWEMRGVPLRLEIGPKDIENKRVVLVRRDTGEKVTAQYSEIANKAKELLDEIQNHLFNKAKENLKKAIVEIDTWPEFLQAVENKKAIFAPFCGQVACEDAIKEKTKGANTRCRPFDQKPNKKPCVHCGKPAHAYYYFGKCY